jgi:hypothetical protein
MRATKGSGSRPHRNDLWGGADGRRRYPLLTDDQYAHLSAEFPWLAEHTANPWFLRFHSGCTGGVEADTERALSFCKSICRSIERRGLRPIIPGRSYHLDRSPQQQMLPGANESDSALIEGGVDDYADLLQMILHGDQEKLESFCC